MSPRDAVLARYPNAIAKERVPLHGSWAGPPASRSTWIVFTGPNLTARRIGRGSSEEAAWKDAATTVQAEIEQERDAGGGEG